MLDTEVSPFSISIFVFLGGASNHNPQARRIDVSSPKDKTDFSLVPSLPPVIIPRDAPHAGNPHAIARSFSYGRTQTIVAGRGGRGVSPFHANASVVIQCIEPGRPALPWVRSGDGSDGHGNAVQQAQRGRVLGQDVPKGRRSASVDRRAGVSEAADKRRVLGPLSVVELERRRSGKGMGKGKGRKRNGPRVVGKENVVLCEAVGVGSRRARSVDGGVLSGYCRQ